MVRDIWIVFVQFIIYEFRLDIVIFWNIYTHLTAYLNVLNKYKIRLEFYISLNTSPFTKWGGDFSDIWIVLAKPNLWIVSSNPHFLIFLCTLQVYVDEADQYWFHVEFHLSRNEVGTYELCFQILIYEVCFQILICFGIIIHISRHIWIKWINMHFIL